MMKMRLSLTHPVTGGELDAIEAKLADILKKSGVHSYEVTTTPFEADEKEFGIYPKYWGVYQIRCGEDVPSFVSTSIREFCRESGLTW